MHSSSIPVTPLDSISSIAPPSSSRRNFSLIAHILTKMTRSEEDKKLHAKRLEKKAKDDYEAFKKLMKDMNEKACDDYYPNSLEYKRDHFRVQWQFKALNSLIQQRLRRDAKKIIRGCEFDSDRPCLSISSYTKMVVDNISNHCSVDIDSNFPLISDFVLDLQIVLPVVLFYMEFYLLKTQNYLDHVNFQNLFLISLHLALKSSFDFHFNNASFVLLAGLPPTMLEKFNALERALFFSLNCDVYLPFRRRKDQSASMYEIYQNRINSKVEKITEKQKLSTEVTFHLSKYAASECWSEKSNDQSDEVLGKYVNKAKPSLSSLGLYYTPKNGGRLLSLKYHDEQKKIEADHKIPLPADIVPVGKSYF